ncbi:MAG: prolipoprotein diacylglyceryl transferase [Microbacteriaceae bacterium]|nr:prolipoprotein diacylglyceryl transferase [Microbacteriaceae bacterium]
MVLPLSIPSPSAPWQVFNLGQWLRDIGWTSFGLNINLRASTACIVVGLIVALILTSRRMTKRGAEPGIAVDIVIWAIPLGIIGARVVHVLTHYQDYFGAGKDPIAILQFWLGGMSVFGAILGGLLGVVIGCAIDGLRVGSVLDAAVPGTLFALASERLGDWFDWQYFGTPTTLPWGLQLPAKAPGLPVGLPSGTLFQPTFLYELLWDLVGIAVLLFIGQRLSLQWGKLFALMLVWYGLGRSWFESLRIDPSLHFAGIRTNVWLAWLAAAIGIIAYIALSRRHTGQEPSVYRQGREWSPASAVDSDDTYPEVDESKEAVVPAKSPAKVKATRSVTSGAGSK